jgi:pSer/pThr/pTyr-binding forkhead associated (FHA) protein
MFTRITLTAVEGALAGKKFVLGQRGCYIIGRADDCEICVAGDLISISRHHCVVNVEPPIVSVRDLGSRNGTFVNGDLVGRRSPTDPPDDAGLHDDFMNFELNNGDMLRLGELVFRVGIVEVATHEERRVPARASLQKAAH